MMHVGSLEYVLPDFFPPKDLPSTLAARKPNYPLALGWSFVAPNADGSFNRKAVHQSLTERFSLMGRSPLPQFDDEGDAETLCHTLGFEGAYVAVGDTASDLAEQCLAKLQSRKSADGGSRYAAVIYTHSTPEEDPNLTPAFRIQSAINDDLSLPFSVSGSCSASFLSAVQTAEALLRSRDDDLPVLIVAADRFLPPVHPRIGSFTLFSDAASAIEISPVPVPGGMRILGTSCRPCTAGEFEWYGQTGPEDIEQEIAHSTAKLIKTFLREHGVSPDDITAVAPQVVSHSLLGRILQELPDLPGDRLSQMPGGNFATSAIPIALSAAAEHLAPGELVLGWCSGLDGTVGVILAEKEA